MFIVFCCHTIPCFFLYSFSSTFYCSRNRCHRSSTTSLRTLCVRVCPYEDPNRLSPRATLSSLQFSLLLASPISWSFFFLSLCLSYPIYEFVTLGAHSTHVYKRMTCSFNLSCPYSAVIAKGHKGLVLCGSFVRVKLWEPRRSERYSAFRDENHDRITQLGCSVDRTNPLHVFVYFLSDLRTLILSSTIVSTHGRPDV